ncbi:MBOAT, membrane-bound O-acyltransferase family-domain-containing protein [Blastocladiella britannica]|nr:MBOAT, membrane-bound O-acyltransferase family-domain-containing protein [Blastocladiella britannica]
MHEEVLFHHIHGYFGTSAVMQALAKLRHPRSTAKKNGSKNPGPVARIAPLSPPGQQPPSTKGAERQQQLMPGTLPPDVRLIIRQRSRRTAPPTTTSSPATAATSAVMSASSTYPPSGSSNPTSPLTSPLTEDPPRMLSLMDLQLAVLPARPATASPSPPDSGIGSDHIGHVTTHALSADSSLAPSPSKKTKKVVRRVLVLKDGSTVGSDSGVYSDSSVGPLSPDVSGSGGVRVVRRVRRSSPSDIGSSVVATDDHVAPIRIVRRGGGAATTIVPAASLERKLPVGYGSPATQAMAASAAAAEVTKVRADAEEPFPKNKASIHALPAHRKPAFSPLSKEAEEQSYRGLINVCAMLLVVSNLRLIIENLSKYGLLVKSPFTGELPTGDARVALGLLLFNAGNALASYSLERECVAQGIAYFFNELTLRSYMWINLALTLVIPVIWVWFAIDSPIYGTAVLMCSVVLFLKLTSYHLVNAELRYFHAYAFDINTYGNPGDRRPAAVRAQYPNNITLGNLVEYISFPTLCYQPSYPRTPRVRVRYVLRHALETIVSLSLMYIIIFQYMEPIMQNTMYAITDPDTREFKFDATTAVSFVERLLKLSLAVVPFWLLMFYSMFHSWVNLLAEVTRFADREFYMAWWNASTIAAYWRLWNQPVHRWLKRHLYIPMVAGKGLPNPYFHPLEPQVSVGVSKSKGYSKLQAALAIFFVSAVFHELIIAPPVKIFRLHAFNAMFLQVPLVIISEVFDSWYRKSNPSGINTAGNLFMWTVFCVIGQPMGGMLYYIEYCAREQCVVY